MEWGGICVCMRLCDAVQNEWCRAGSNCRNSERDSRGSEACAE